MVRSISQINYNLSILNERNAKVNTALGTGEALEYGSDDAVQYSHILTVQKEKNSYIAIKDYITVSQAYNTISDDTMSQIKDSTDAMIGDLIEANTDTTGQEQREIIATQLEDYRNSLFALANTQVDGQYIFSGVDTDLTPFVRDPVTDEISYQSNYTTRTVNVETGTYAAQGINGIQAFYYPNNEVADGTSFTFDDNEVVIDSDGNEWRLMDANNDGTMDGLYLNADITSSSMAVTDNLDGTFTATNSTGDDIKVNHSIFDDLTDVINALRLEDNAGNPITKAQQHTAISSGLDKIREAYSAQNISHSLVGTRTNAIESYGTMVSTKITNLKVLEEQYAGADVTALAIQAQSLENTYTALYSTIQSLNSMSLARYMN